MYDYSAFKEICIDKKIRKEATYRSFPAAIFDNKYWLILTAREGNMGKCHPEITNADRDFCT